MDFIVCAVHLGRWHCRGVIFSRFVSVFLKGVDGAMSRCWKHLTVGLGPLRIAIAFHGV
jgi:hypothetical protein